MGFLALLLIIGGVYFLFECCGVNSSGSSNNSSSRTSTQNRPFNTSTSNTSSNSTSTTSSGMSSSGKKRADYPIKIVGVRFLSQQSGCYHYKDPKDMYKVGDEVLVPTSISGNQVAKVVFAKKYNTGEELPYSGEMKEVIYRPKETPKPVPKEESYEDYGIDYEYDYRDDLPQPEDFYMEDDYMSGFHTDDDGNWIPDGVGDPDDPTQFFDDDY